jgi:hypothetical protein
MLDAVHAFTGLGFPTSVSATGARSTEEGFDTMARAALTIQYAGALSSLSIDGAANRVEERWSVDADNGRMEFGAAIRGPEPETTRRHLANFFESIRTRTPPNATVANTLPATLICQMANLSLSNGRPVSWNAAQFRVESGE